jgi:hypothetical protein
MFASRLLHPYVRKRLLLGHAYALNDTVFSIANDPAGIAPYELSFTQKWGSPYTIVAGSPISSTAGGGARRLSVKAAGAQGGEICFPVRNVSNVPFVAADGLYWARWQINEGDLGTPLTLLEKNVVNVTTLISGAQRNYSSVATRDQVYVQITSGPTAGDTRIFSSATGNQISTFVPPVASPTTDGKTLYFVGAGLGFIPNETVHYVDLSHYDTYPVFDQNIYRYSTMSGWSLKATGFPAGKFRDNGFWYVADDGSLQQVTVDYDASWFFPLGSGPNTHRLFYITVTGSPIHFGDSLYVSVRVQAHQIDDPTGSSVSRSFACWSGLMLLKDGVATLAVRYGQARVYDAAPIPAGPSVSPGVDYQVTGGIPADGAMQAQIAAVSDYGLNAAAQRRSGFVGVDFPLVLPFGGGAPYHVISMSPALAAGGAVITHFSRFGLSGAVSSRTSWASNLAGSFNPSFLSDNGADDVIQFVNLPGFDRILSVDGGVTYATTTALPNLNDNWIPLFTVR